MGVKRLLVLGCGRSGTRYTSNVFLAIGLNIEHEMPGLDGMVDWHSVGRPDDLQAHSVILHQVREPLGVIASFHTVTEGTWRFIYATEPFISPDDPLTLRCMKYWFYWNERAAEVANRTYRVEGIEEELPSICEELGYKLPPEYLERIRRIPKNDHTRKIEEWGGPIYPELDWTDLESVDAKLTNKIRIQAEKYGYPSKVLI